ncbi:hypothetical protein EPO33_04175 [Patescibacteria group bacterium]|nr:MAG: hypothetical protein EPO33_04175 [Patescibacteria group bacterium]
MSVKNTLTLTAQDETTIAKLLGFKSLKGFMVEAWTAKDGVHVVHIRGEEQNGSTPRFEIRLVRDGAEAPFAQAPTNQNVRVLRDLIEKRGLAEIDLDAFAQARQHKGIPLAMDNWRDGLRRAVAQLRDIYRQRMLPMMQEVERLEAFLASQAASKPAVEAEPLAAE